MGAHPPSDTPLCTQVHNGAHAPPNHPPHVERRIYAPANSWYCNASTHFLFW